MLAPRGQDGGKKECRETYQTIERQKIEYKANMQKNPPSSATMLGPLGGNIGRGKPLPEECQEPLPRELVGLKKTEKQFFLQLT